jgi:hypothetical protein
MTDAPDDDTRLVNQLADVLRRVDPIPAEVTLAARSALAWRRMDAELAELLHDSAIEAAAGAAMRSTARLRALTFEAPSGLTIEVEIALQDDRCLLSGQLVPPTAARLVVRHPGGAETVESDSLGRFRVEGVHPGPVSLRCEPSDGVAIETGWITI